MSLRRFFAATCVVFVVGEVVLRLSWIAGGRWGYTACDRTDLGDQPAGGCGADQVVAVPFGAGWGALGLCVVLAVVIAYADRLKPAVTWVAAVILLVLAFPLHLLFEIPAGVAGHPTDWRDIGGRVVLLAGGIAFAGLANAVGPPRGPAPTGFRRVPGWARRWAYVAVALPVVGWAVPHGLWVLGVPFGISEQTLRGADGDLSTATGVAITVVPPLAGLLVLGLVQRWGQRFPRWVPGLGGRRVPRLLAVLPAGTVAITLATYGVLSFGVFAGQVLDGEQSWAQVRDGWATVATLLVFLGWGVAVGVTTAGYVVATRGPADG
ncbi:hypothetical protein KZ829_24245 [Actinoplanes hulinensis]|uniref:Uncharacterized protein n=1 Tax=Actinoplanes hulinensis TaxID=1144547 RepID=A0ABS7B725_9ACTN|nr:hypothetical protein [Actinoplanes hulinensis]MBW6436859.1 hypothetical protein [Actinoplanes hulinensis]